MSTIIKLRCIDQVLTFESTPVIASGGLEEDALQVSFCSKWDGLAKTAVFWLPEAEEEAYHVPLDLAGGCKIPREVLAKDGVFYFGVFGVSEDGRQRTTEAVRYVVVKGAITSGTKPSDPTPDVYTQLLAKYAEAQAIAQQAVAEADAAAAAAAATLVELEAARAAAMAEIEATRVASLAEVETSRKAAESAAAAASVAVPNTRKINNKPLNADISLDAADVGARPNTWMPTAADVGAAPVGFGLGDSSNRLDWNAITKNGFYSGATNSPNGNTWVGFAYNDPSVGRVEHATGWEGDATYDMQRVTYDGKGEWECVNPPLHTGGTEYRTTERIGRKAVYKRNNGGVIEYRLDGETEWKPYATAVGAPSLTGFNTFKRPVRIDAPGNSSVDLKWTEKQVYMAQFALGYHTAWINAFNDGANTKTYRALGVHSSSYKNLANAISLHDVVDNVATEYHILHTGSVPNACNFITGSYVGTGTVGANGKNELTFPFEPKYVVVYQSTGLGGLAMEFIRPLESINVTRSISSSANYNNYAEWIGNTLRWWMAKRESLIDGGSGEPSAGAQSNNSGQTYYYAAWG